MNRSERRQDAKKKKIRGSQWLIGGRHELVTVDGVEQGAVTMIGPMELAAGEPFRYAVRTFKEEHGCSLVWRFRVRVELEQLRELLQSGEIEGVTQHPDCTDLVVCGGLAPRAGHA